MFTKDGYKLYLLKYLNNTQNVFKISCNHNGVKGKFIKFDKYMGSFAIKGG